MKKNKKKSWERPEVSFLSVKRLTQSGKQNGTEGSQGNNKYAPPTS